MRGLTLAAVCLLVVVVVILGIRATPPLQAKPVLSSIAWPLYEKQNQQISQVPLPQSNRVIPPDILLD